MAADLGGMADTARAGPGRAGPLPPPHAADLIFNSKYLGAAGEQQPLCTGAYVLQPRISM